MSDFTVYDAGALVAADKNQRKFLRGHELLIGAGDKPVLPAPVLAQAWLPGSRHASLHRVVKSCEIISFTKDEAREVARLCRKAGSADVVDAFVVYSALRYDKASIVTSDIVDIKALLSGEPGAKAIVIRKP
jgi:hypothetical protein